MFSALLLSVALQAAQPAQQATATQEDPQRLVCRTESVVGSNRRRRVCLTAAERDAMRNHSREIRENMDRQYNEGAAGASGGPANPWAG